MNHTPLGFTFKLNPEHKQKWLTALRSGEYQQGRTFLRLGTEYCCLGVYAEVCRQEEINSTSHPTMQVGERFRELELPSTWIPVDVQSALMRMNDNDQKTFPEIADWIEEHL